MAAANAVATAAPTYLAMFETPDAPPTCSAGTQDVEAADAGPLVSAMPTATRTSGSRKATYRQSDWVNPIQAKPTAVMTKPPATSRLPVNRAASLGTMGATTTSPTVAGSVARPAWSGVKPSELGSW